MPNQEQEKPLSMSAQLLEQSIKTMKKKVGQETEARLQAGQNPYQIISDLVRTLPQKPTKEEITNLIGDMTEVPIPTGEREGLVSGAFRGHGFGRLGIPEI